MMKRTAHKQGIGHKHCHNEPHGDYEGVEVLDRQIGTLRQVRANEVRRVTGQGEGTKILSEMDVYNKTIKIIDSPN